MSLRARILAQDAADRPESAAAHEEMKDFLKKNGAAALQRAAVDRQAAFHPA